MPRRWIPQDCGAEPCASETKALAAGRRRIAAYQRRVEQNSSNKRLKQAAALVGVLLENCH